ncbi:hypothetical protein VCHC56A2_0767, partial [Vibrio cholerae HC-56A2]
MPIGSNHKVAYPATFKLSASAA